MESKNTLKEKLNILLEGVSHYNVIAFRILPKDNIDFIPTKTFLDEFLSSCEIEENCLEHVFLNDVLFATLICIYLFKEGTSLKRKPSSRLKYLKSLFKLIMSFRKANQLTEKKYLRLLDVIVKELFISRLGCLFKTFDDNANKYFAGLEYDSNKQEIFKILNDEKLCKDDLLFDNLFELSTEINTINFRLFEQEDAYTRLFYFSLIKIVMLKALALLEEYSIDFDAKFGLMDTGVSLYYKKNDKNFDFKKYKRDILEILSFGDKYIKIARTVNLLLYTYESNYNTENYMLCFIDTIKKMDILSSDLRNLSEFYKEQYSYDTKYLIEIIYYKFFVTIYSNEKNRRDFTEDLIQYEAKEFLYALLKLVNDSMCRSYTVTTKVSKYFITYKFPDYHFALIENELDEENKIYLASMCKFLYKSSDLFFQRKVFTYSTFFKEILLDDALKNKKYDVAKTLLKLNKSGRYEIPILYILRKYNYRTYMAVLSKILSEDKKKYIEELQEKNTEYLKLYGQEFCSELLNFCSTD